MGRSKMFITKQNGFVFGGVGFIMFPAPDAEDWELVSSAEARKKIGEPGAIWNPRMGRTFEEWLEGNDVSFTDGKSLRIGCSAVVVDPRRGLLQVQFDSGHPTTPNEWSVPVGLWGTYPIGVEGIIKQALLALGREIIVTKKQGNMTIVGFWQFDGDLVAQNEVCSFVARYIGSGSSFAIDTNFCLNLDINYAIDGTVVNFGRDDENPYEFIISCEPQTGSLEIGVPFEADIPNDVILIDGEVGEDGKPLNRRIKFFKVCPASQAAIAVLGKELTAAW